MGRFPGRGSGAQDPSKSQKDVSSVHHFALGKLRREADWQTSPVITIT